VPEDKVCPSRLEHHGKKKCGYLEIVHVMVSLLERRMKHTMASLWPKLKSG
jgi:hypothetical protein